MTPVAGVRRLSAIGEATSIHIGTSGWHYKHWKGSFYPKQIVEADMLDKYAQRLDTVEINNSFYRLPTEKAVKSWFRQTPPDFVFAVKASRYITHNRKLKDPKETIAKFLHVVNAFGKKLGPILFQLPPSWKVNRLRLQEFLAALPAKHRYVFEFRNQTWHIPEIYSLLKLYNAAYCIFELNGFRTHPEVTADFVYVRLHGPGKAYQGNYSSSDLRDWARTIENWVGQKREVFVYFDNDQAGFAAKNALSLKRLLQR